MGITAHVAEIFTNLAPYGLAGLALVLCFIGIALWVTRGALKADKTVKVKITLRSLEYEIGSKETNKPDALPQDRGRLEIESTGEIATQSTDEKQDDNER